MLDLVDMFIDASQYFDDIRLGRLCHIVYDSFLRFLLYYTAQTVRFATMLYVTAYNCHF